MPIPDTHTIEADRPSLVVASQHYSTTTNGDKMREITSHVVNPVNDKIKITVMDEPGAGGANHNYLITTPDWTRAPDGSGAKGVWDINFQNGPIAEHGVNGVTQEVLLAIVADRLESFQAGPFACPENRNALAHVQDAMTWLQSRTKARMARGVEGKNIA
jgi:hypothetical protein